jgi:hypothetical protein
MNGKNQNIGLIETVHFQSRITLAHHAQNTRSSTAHAFWDKQLNGLQKPSKVAAIKGHNFPNCILFAKNISALL